VSTLIPFHFGVLLIRPGKHVQRPTKVRPARATQSPFSTLVTKILKLKARVRLDQRARQIKLPKLIQQFACRPSVNNSRRASCGRYLHRPPDNRLLLTLVCRMLWQHKIHVSQIAVDLNCSQRRSERSQQKRIGLWTKQRINLGQEFVIGGGWGYSRAPNESVELNSVWDIQKTDRLR
jgi:hypothetical protein